MEYQFRKEYATGRITINMSMGHEAFAAWLEQEGEKGEWLLVLQQKLNHVEQCANREFKLAGSEFTLFVSDEAVQVSHNSLLNSHYDSELPDGEPFDYYDQELRAECGLEDFILFISSWAEFI